jgi:glucose-6-phosphate dehydrogenase assembly protein OpcA
MSDPTHWDSGGIPVALAHIEKELNLFWRQQAQAEDTAVLRASTLTLIIVTRTEQQYQAALQAIPELISHHPGRIILIRIGMTTSSGRVEGFISAHCQLAHPGGRQLCCEQITLVCPSGQEWTLHGILLPLLLTDLPVFLWWPEEYSPSLQLTQSLWSFIDRLIINSSHLQVTWQQFRQHCRALQDLHGQILVTDLCWAGITDWREAIAQCFDATSNTKWLDGLYSVRLFYGESGEPVSGFWLVAWLATLLGWSNSDPAHLSFKCGERDITVESVLAPAATGADLAGIELCSQLDGQKRCFSIMRRSGERLAINDGERDIELRSPHVQDGELMCRELDLAGSDNLYQKIYQAMA